jgi:hypothetical protein
MTVICLDGYGFDLVLYSNVTKWYGLMQKNETDIWELGVELRDGVKTFHSFDKAMLPKRHIYHPCNPSEYK